MQVERVTTMNTTKITITSLTLVCAVAIVLPGNQAKHANHVSAVGVALAGKPLNASNREENPLVSTSPAAVQNIFNSRAVIEQLERTTGKNLNPGEIA
jgi:hypothetical protein